MVIICVCDRCKKKVNTDTEILMGYITFPYDNEEEVLLCRDCIKEFKKFIVAGKKKRPSRIMYNIFRSLRSTEK